MKKDYKKQTIDHTVKEFNLIVKNNLDIFSFVKILTQAN